jgi:hypothetical protein
MQLYCDCIPTTKKVSDCIPTVIMPGLYSDCNCPILNTVGILYQNSIVVTRGAVYVGRFVRLVRADSAEISGANPTTKPRKMSILAAQQMLGHKSKDSTRLTAKSLGITIMRGSMPVCEACALSRVKQKNVPKKSTSEPVTRPFQRVHTDISQIKVLDED